MIENIAERGQRIIEVRHSKEEERKKQDQGSSTAQTKSKINILCFLYGDALPSPSLSPKSQFD